MNTSMHAAVNAREHATAELRSALPARAGVVVVGGGIAGVALAYFLAERGASDVLVVEARTLASGCTGGSLGGVRQQFSTPEQVELAVRGRTFWREFGSRFDCAFDFHEDGYLMFTGREDTLEKLEAAADVQRAAGAVNVHILGRDAVRDVVPWLNTDGVIGASWTPEDGHMNPTDGVYVLASAARRRGVTFREHTLVTGLTALKEGWAVHTRSGDVAAQQVVVACGLGSPALLEPFGLDLPIAPMPIHYGFTTPVLEGQRLPLVLDLDTGLCVEREQDGAMVTILESAYAGTPDDMLVQFASIAAQRAPIFADVGIRRTVTAAADATGGDGHPFIGEVEAGLWAMTGFDGHGTMQGPALGEFTANLLSGLSDPILSAATFDPHRAPAVTHEWLRAAKR
jgi:sarcosine oxidase subunit beta